MDINWYPGHMAKAKRLLSDQLGRCDVVIELCDARLPFSSRNPDLARMTNGKKRILLLNKADLAADKDKVTEQLRSRCGAGGAAADDSRVMWVSAEDKTNINELKELIASLAPSEDNDRRIVGDLIGPDDLVVLVIPIDKAAPKGRLILPQQQTIRDILESDAAAVVVKENGLKEVFRSLDRKPALHPVHIVLGTVLQIQGRPGSTGKGSAYSG